MKRILIAVLCLPFMLQSTEAKPHPKLKKIATAAYIIGVPTAFATWNTIATQRCRHRVDVEKCETGYGAWIQAQVATHILSDVVMPAVTYGLKHTEERNGDEHRFWYYLPLAVAGGNAYMAVNQMGQQPDKRTHCDHDKKFNGFACVDKKGE